jgi:integrase
VSLGIHAITGKRERRYFSAKTQKEIQQLLIDFNQGILPQRSGSASTTLKSFIENWLNDEIKINRRAKIYLSYESVLRLYVLPVLGKRRLSEIKPAEIQRCLSLAREKCSSSMAARVRTILHRVMARAQAMELVHRNPVTATEAPRSIRREAKFLTAEQMYTLFDAARGDRLEALVVLLAISGLRIGEALALQWKDIDMTEMRANITKTAQESIGAPQLVPPKTRAGQRTIKFGANVLESLQARQRLAQAEGFNSPHDLVFPTQVGTIIRKSNLHRRWWKPLLEKAKLDYLRIHDLRHSSASLSLLAGTNPKVLAERLGHADASFTMRTYAHVVRSLADQDANALDALIDQARANHQANFTP